MQRVHDDESYCEDSSLTLAIDSRPNSVEAISQIKQELTRPFTVITVHLIGPSQARGRCERNLAQEEIGHLQAADFAWPQLLQQAFLPRFRSGRAQLQSCRKANNTFRFVGDWMGRNSSGWSRK
jgi:hypothetical protein